VIELLHALRGGLETLIMARVKGHIVDIQDGPPWFLGHALRILPDLTETIPMIGGTRVKLHLYLHSCYSGARGTSQKCRVEPVRAMAPSIHARVRWATCTDSSSQSYCFC